MGDGSDMVLTTDQDRRALAVAVAQAVVEAQASERAAAAANPAARVQRWVGIAGGAVGLIGVALAAASWGFGLQADVQAVRVEIARLSSTVESLDTSVQELRDGRWTRNDHDQFVRDTVTVIDERVRALEAKVARVR